MKKYKKVTPEGTKDVLFEECVARRIVERRLSNLYKLRGYSRVLTPTIEFYDVFDREIAGVGDESMYKLTDNHGRLLVLRPDSTVPIARLAATRLKGAALPLRLYYTQSVYRMNTSLSGKSNEIAQSGIELIGANGIKSDLEVLVTAVNALESCKAAGFRMEIGHAGFFKGICSAMGADAETRDELTYLFESKNYVAVNELLDRIGDTPVTRLIRELPRMFGGEEIIERVSKMVDTPECTAALNYLREIYGYVRELGIGDVISIDLGMVHRSNYYTGIIFRGYLEGAGVTALSGGRYDGLLSEFGENLPAIGFGVDVDAVTNMLLNSGDTFGERVPSRLVYAECEDEMQALKYIMRMNEDGVLCENSVQSSLDGAMRYAAEKGIELVDVISSDGSVKTLEV